MQGTRIFNIGILIIFIITTYSFSQVTMEVKNINTSAGTLDIYMTPLSGCSNCSDTTPEYVNDEKDCLAYGTDPNSAADETIKDATWDFDSSSPNATTCAGVCSNAGVPTGHGTCASGVITYSIYIYIKNHNLIFTMPFVILCFLRYLYLSSKTSKGEFPIDLFFQDRILLLSGCIYMVLIVVNFL